MNNDITIVTAFYDIGRGDWTTEKGYPHYLQRTTDTYFERFAHLASLENEMFIFTSRDMIDRVAKLRCDRPTTIFEFDYAERFAKLKDEIEWVQIQPEFRTIINPRESKNPEYWNADYVLINSLKSTFACMASIQAKNNMLAWLDFGYCRTKDTLANVKHWRYSFDPSKIHFFGIKDYNGLDIPHIISNNIVYVTDHYSTVKKLEQLEWYVQEARQSYKNVL